MKRRGLLAAAIALPLILGGCAGLTWPMIAAGAGAVAMHCVEAVGNCVTNAKNDVKVTATVIHDTAVVAHDLVPVAVKVHRGVAAFNRKVAAIFHRKPVPQPTTVIVGPAADVASAPVAARVGCAMPTIQISPPAVVAAPATPASNLGHDLLALGGALIGLGGVAYGVYQRSKT